MSVFGETGNINRTATGIFVQEGGLWHRIKKLFGYSGAWRLGWNLGIPAPTPGTATMNSTTQATVTWTNGTYSVANGSAEEFREIDGAGKYWHYLYFTPDENCESARVYMREDAAVGDPNAPWQLEASHPGPFTADVAFLAATDGGWTGGYNTIEWLVVCYANTSYVNQGFSVRATGGF